MRINTKGASCGYQCSVFFNGGKCSLLERASRHRMILVRGRGCRFWERHEQGIQYLVVFWQGGHKYGEHRLHMSGDSTGT